MARSVVAVEEGQVSQDVVLVFEQGDPARPIIMGVLLSVPKREASGPMENLVLTASRAITLRCGQSTLTLTRAGKILLRGAYILSRSSGVNRVKGGAVQIN